MLEPFEYTGLWWIPENPENKIAGILRYIPGEWAKLDLIGSFKDVRELTRTSRFDIILGVIIDGGMITLYKCIETRTRISSPGTIATSFVCNVVFFGGFFYNINEIKFREISVNYLHLDEWINISGFSFTFPNRGIKEGITIRYKLPEILEADINEDWKIEIGFSSSGPSLSQVQKNLNIEQTTFIIFKPKNEKNYEEYIEKIYQIQNFLSLAVMKPVFPLIIEGQTESNKALFEGKIFYPPIKIFYKIASYYKKEEIAPYKMLFSFKDIADNFQSFINNWFKKMEFITSSSSLYFATLHNPYINIQHKLLNIIQAIEAYHREIFRESELNLEEHNRKIDKIIAFTPSEYNEWLRDKLRYSYEPSLRNRLKDIVLKFEDIVGTYKESKSFIDQVVNLRNDLIHPDATRKVKLIEGVPLRVITKRIENLFEICLLSELGFSNDEIKKLIKKYNKYN